MLLAEAPAAAAAAEAADGMVWADAGAASASGGGSDSDDEEGGLAAYAYEAPTDDVAAVSRRQLIHSGALSCGASGSCCSSLNPPPKACLPPKACEAQLQGLQGACKQLLGCCVPCKPVVEACPSADPKAALRAAGAWRGGGCCTNSRSRRRPGGDGGRAAAAAEGAPPADAAALAGRVLEGGPGVRVCSAPESSTDRQQGCIACTLGAAAPCRRSAGRCKLLAGKTQLMPHCHLPRHCCAPR
jgi:hypothetical protein